MTATLQGYQPHETLGLSVEDFLTLAEQKEHEGLILVVETLWNAYPVDEEGSWVYDLATFDHYRTGRRVAGFDPDQGEEYPDNLFVVRRRIKER